MIALRHVAAVAVLVSVTPVFAAPTPEQVEYFEKNVRPVLATSCQPCHNAKMKSSGLDLSSAAGFLQGGAGGAIVANNHPEASRLLKAVSYEDALKMPPAGKLKPEQIESLTNWVKMGAPWPGAEGAAVSPKPILPKDFTPEQKAYWAFQPLSQPPLPKIKGESWARTPVDRFILAKLEERSLRPAPPASKAALLRRVTFDLTGLPPTTAELESFEADRSPQAYEKVVDRLLASPRYGEHWGRHWLDIARYADSTGNDEDHRYPYAWRYRDYVIDAFNHDLPYDRFVLEQLAGDLLPPAPGDKVNARGIVATGFLALGAKALAQVDKKKMLYDVWDEQVDVTSKAFLGLTMACARCHDHKFDPIRTKDYYSMVGMFASTRAFDKPLQNVSTLFYRPLVPENAYAEYRKYQATIGLQTLGVGVLTDAAMLRRADEEGARIARYMLGTRSGGNTAGLDPAILAKWTELLKPTQEDRHWLAAWTKASAEEAPAVAQHYQEQFLETLKGWKATVAKARTEERVKLESGDPAVSKPKEESKDLFFMAVYFGKGPLAVPEKEREKLLSTSEEEQAKQFRATSDDLKKHGPAEPPMADAVAEDTPVAQKVLLRGDYNNLGEDAPRAVPAILTRVEPAPETFHGSGRLELARWISNPSNPLTARVMVNRLWGWHFGDGIVSTADNFGKMGARPSHPELLDFLAGRFIQDGWSVKKIQRLIVLSNTYRMASDADEKTLAADPDGSLLTRFPRQRLSVEEIRDGMLYIDGTLDLAMGGSLQSGFGTDSENSGGRLSLNPENNKRRTVYLPLRRANLPTLLNLFDFGDATTVNGKRSLTNVAPQALFMMNSEFVSERAKNIAATMLKDEALSGRERLEQIYLKTLDRKPAPEETDAAFTYMDRLKVRFHASDAEAWQSFCHILLTANEFLYLE